MVYVHQERLPFLNTLFPTLAQGRPPHRPSCQPLHRPLSLFRPCRELALKLEEDRKRLVEAINTTFGNLGSAASSLLTDRDKLLTFVGGATLLALGVYSAREGTRVAGKGIDRWFGTPKLVSTVWGVHGWSVGRGGAGCGDGGWLRRCVV